MRTEQKINHLIEFVNMCKWLCQEDKPQDYKQAIESVMIKAQALDTNIFPNGFDSWQETHFDVVSNIADAISEDGENVVTNTAETKGHGGLYELAEDWTNEFELINKGADWDGEYTDQLDTFISSKFI
jgi:hypothetical protein